VIVLRDRAHVARLGGEQIDVASILAAIAEAPAAAPVAA